MIFLILVEPSCILGRTIIRCLAIAADEGVLNRSSSPLGGDLVQGHVLSWLVVEIGALANQLAPRDLTKRTIPRINCWGSLCEACRLAGLLMRGPRESIREAVA